MTTLTAFANDLWLASGPCVGVMGFDYPTRMAVIRLPDGGLFVWSPIALGGDLADEIAALGPVSHVVAPNTLHHLALDAWQAAFPEARFWAAPGLREKRRDIAFHGDLGDDPAAGWAGSLDQVIVHGNLITTEVVFFHRPSGTILFTDLIQHFPPGWFSGWRAIVARLDLMTAPHASVPRKFRLAFTDRHAARDAIARILNWPARAVVMAHGTPVTQDARARLAAAFAWLTR